MMSRYFRFCSVLLLIVVSSLHAEPLIVSVREISTGCFELYRGAKLYFIKGAGGHGDKEQLALYGGNSLRTWDVGESTGAFLDEAHKHGLTVTLGIWLGHERHGFDYANQQHLRKQIEKVRQSVERYKDHPALLAWGLGNEMEGFEQGDNHLIWKHIQKLAAMVKDIDPNHPTLTTIAEIGGKRIESINTHCPAIDIIGINSYGRVTTIPTRYRQAGGVKPYILTEYGPPGIWETPPNQIGAAEELTSTQKAARYRDAYINAISPELGKLCLGGYAFIWGAKQEATATWFGMLLPDGNKTQAVDIMTQMWTGKFPENRCPEIQHLAIQGSNQVKPGDRVVINIKASDPENDPLTVEWQLHEETRKFKQGGDAEDPTMQYPEAIIEANNQQVTLKMPQNPWIYRIFVIVRDGHGSAAVANMPILVIRD